MKHAAQKPEKTLSAALVLAARVQRARAAAMLAEVGLYPGQDRALEVLVANPDGLTMGELAGKLQVKPPTASKTIARLSQQGLVQREDSVDDARRVRVNLTDEGRDRARILPELSARLEAEMIDDLDAKERKRFRKLLRRVTKSIAKAGGIEAADFDLVDEDDGPDVTVVPVAARL